jgi:hypothetical protein
MPNLQTDIDYLSRDNLSNRDMGTRFEEGARLFLLNAPLYAPRLKRVMTYQAWADEQVGSRARFQHVPAEREGVHPYAGAGLPP